MIVGSSRAFDLCPFHFCVRYALGYLLARLSVHNVTCVEAILDTSELALDDLALGTRGSTALGFNNSARFFAQLLSLPSWTDSSFKGPVGRYPKYLL
jgi:hypothetical protein